MEPTADDDPQQVSPPRSPGGLSSPRSVRSSDDNSSARMLATLAQSLQLTFDAADETAFMVDVPESLLSTNAEDTTMPFLAMMVRLVLSADGGADDFFHISDMETGADRSYRRSRSPTASKHDDAFSSLPWGQSGGAALLRRRRVLRAQAARAPQQ